MSGNEQINKMYDTSHGLWKLFDKLEASEIDVISQLISAMGVGDIKTMTSYYEGYINGYLYHRFGVCPTCRVSHEENDHSYFDKALSAKIDNLFGKDKADKIKDKIATATAAPTEKPEEEFYPKGQYL